MSPEMSAIYRISNPDPLIDLEPGFRGSRRAARAVPEPQTPRIAETAYPLGMVLNACPDISDYAKGGLRTGATCWRPRPLCARCLGSVPAPGRRRKPSWAKCRPRWLSRAFCSAAQSAPPAAICAVRTERAKVGEFSLGPILMSQINAQLRTKRSA